MIDETDRDDEMMGEIRALAEVGLAALPDGMKTIPGTVLYDMFIGIAAMIIARETQFGDREDDKAARLDG